MTPIAFVAGAQQRDRAVDAAAHRHGDAAGLGSARKTCAERVRERVHGELVTADGRRLEQRQALERPLEPFGLRARRSARPRRPGARAPSARRASNLRPTSTMRSRLAILERRNGGTEVPPSRLQPADAPGPVVNLDKPGGCRVFRRREPLVERQLPLTRCWFYRVPRARTGSSARIVAPGCLATSSRRPSGSVARRRCRAPRRASASGRTCGRAAPGGGRSRA